MALRRLAITRDTPLHPAYVVWELTLACDQPCTHCGSRAGDARANELSTDAALSERIGERTRGPVYHAAVSRS